MNRRTPFVYGLLLLTWVVVLVWQLGEHARVRRTARESIINHAKDVSTTLGLVMRSQRRFGVISQDRMESALKALIKPGELDAIALLNHAGEVVAAAGAPINYELKGLAPRGVHWDRRSVTLVNLVDLGASLTDADAADPPTLVLPRSEMPGPPPFGTNRAGPPPGPPPEEPPSQPPSLDPDTSAGQLGEAEPPPPRPRAWGRGRGGDRRPPFGRPFWMSEAEYRSAIEKQGAHSFVAVLSAQPFLAASAQDLWLRGFITLLATVAVAGLGLAWRTLLQSAELEVRLARASELNARLRDMNLAAGGLAQETRHPLNLIRGLAQTLAQQSGAPPQVVQSSHHIANEADRVTAQLNDFINYSRPREVRRTRVPLNAVCAELKTTLASDLEAKTIRLQIPDDLPVIEADEPLFRQALFHLLANALQAMDHEGAITLTATKPDPHHVCLDIADDGPDVLPEHRADIFKPYFSSNQRGRGLGLAVVHQIALAHGWDIECRENLPRGACFRLAHLRLAPTA
jgi:signal transduction histidine kinase